MQNTKEVQDKLADLFSWVFTSGPVVNAGGELSADVVKQLLEDPKYEESRQQVYAYIYSQIDQLSNDQNVQDRLGSLMRAGVGTMIFGSSNNSDNQSNNETTNNNVQTKE